MDVEKLEYYEKNWKLTETDKIRTGRVSKMFKLKIKK